MRNDISSEIIAKTELRNQTIAVNAEPNISLIIKRKQTAVDDIDFLEKRRARKTTLNTLTDVAIAVEHADMGGEDSYIWISYIEDGLLKVRKSQITAELSDVTWKNVDIGTIEADKCDIVFRAYVNTDVHGNKEYLTYGLPVVFYLTERKIHSLDLETMEDTIVIFTGDVKDFSVKRGPQENVFDGFVMFYLKMDGTLYYRTYENGEWSSRTTHGYSLPSPIHITGISLFDLSGGIGLLAYGDDGKMYQQVGFYDDGFAFSESFREVTEADCNGTVVAYYDGTVEALYSHGTLCAKIGEVDDDWDTFTYGDEISIYKRQYAVMDADHINRGNIYLITLLHGTSYDYLYLFRYMYWDDVSKFVDTAEITLQVDNAIVQTNVDMRNVNDSLYTSDATLFAPSSKLELGVFYGSSEIVPMSVAYIDEVNHEYGGELISISGRNSTGVYLHDQTLDENMDFIGNVSFIHSAILDYFGVPSYHIDTSLDTPQDIIYSVDAGKTGLDILNDLAAMLSNSAAEGYVWKTEELNDGTIIIGYDAFRAQYLPKGTYQFNGMNDVFAKSVQRCVDGAYTKVRCTGTTPDGKEIEYVKDVANFKFWNPGNHKTYHAEKIEGITITELKKYAAALAKQLKYVGRVITYETYLRPQLLIGDIAEIMGDDGEYERIGTITEIMHHFGVSGYTTDFVISSGGIMVDAGSAEAYTSATNMDGANRQRRLTDYMIDAQGKSGKASSSDKETVEFNFVEIIRNIGYRLLDEPRNVEAEYDGGENQVLLKWSDPVDITTYEPVPAEWAGTLVVRSEQGKPLNPWNGTIIIDSTTRDEYSETAFVDDTVEINKLYYYGIFPYYVGLDDEDHPINYYRPTKIVTVDTSEFVTAPVLDPITEVEGTMVVITYTIYPLTVGTYTVKKLVGKKDSIPQNKADGSVIIDLTSGNMVTVTGLDEESSYYFVIFVETSKGANAESEPQGCVTGIDLGYNFEYTGAIQTFTAPKTGIYQLETWGAQGGNAEDSENNLVARGGYGAYATGEVFLTQGETLYINVGGQNGYGGGGSNLPMHNLETWNYRDETVDMSILKDFTQIPNAVKTATSPTYSRIWNQSVSSIPSWLSLGDSLYQYSLKDGPDDGKSYVFVDSDYIKIVFGAYPYGSNTYYGLVIYNKITGDIITYYGDFYTGANELRTYYLSIVIDTPNQRAYLLLANSKTGANYFRVDAHSFMYNGIDLLWETFSNY